MARPEPPALSPHGAAEVLRLRATLRDLEDLALAALLRELGAALYNREIYNWRTLCDISDELIATATLPARIRLTERWLATPTRRPLARIPRNRDAT